MKTKSARQMVPMIRISFLFCRTVNMTPAFLLLQEAKEKAKREGRYCIFNHDIEFVDLYQMFLSF